MPMAMLTGPASDPTMGGHDGKARIRATPDGGACRSSHAGDAGIIGGGGTE
jgi:hypothetical protein